MRVLVSGWSCVDAAEGSHTLQPGQTACCVSKCGLHSFLHVSLTVISPLHAMYIRYRAAHKLHTSCAARLRHARSQLKAAQATAGELTTRRATLTTELAREQAKAAAAAATVQQLTSKVQRGDALLQRLEERRWVVGCG